MPSDGVVSNIERMTADPAFADFVRGEGRDRGGALSLADFTLELEPWLTHKRPGAWARNRRSLDADLTASLAAIGPALRATLGGTLDSYATSARVTTTAAEPSGADLHAALAATRTVRAVLGEPKSLRAAWRDVADALHQGDATLAAERLEQLAAMLRLAGYDESHTLRQIIAVLADSQWAVADLRGAPLGERLQTGQAGLSPDERLQIVDTYLGSPPSIGRCVVWAAYTAQVTRPVSELGPVTIVDLQWGLPNARRAGGQHFPFRAELAAWVPYIPESFGSSDARVVGIRVDLGVLPRSQAFRRALERIDMLVDAAACLGDGRRWQAAGCELLLVDGQAVESSNFDPTRLELRTVWDDERTERELVERAARLATAAIAPSRAFDDLREAARVAQESTWAAPRNRLLLEDRIIELVATHSAMETEGLRGALLEGWPARRLKSELLDAISWAVWCHRRSGGPDLEIQHHDDAGSFTTNLRAALDNRDSLIDATTSSVAAGWIRSRLAALTTPADCVAMLDRYRAEGELLALRLRRCRNALTHGNPVTDQALTSVQRLSTSLGQLALACALDAFGTGGDVASVISREGEYCMVLYEQFAMGSNYLDAVALAAATTWGESPDP